MSSTGGKNTTEQKERGRDPPHPLISPTTLMWTGEIHPSWNLTFSSFLEAKLFSNENNRRLDYYSKKTSENTYPLHITHFWSFLSFTITNFFPSKACMVGFLLRLGEEAGPIATSVPRTRCDPVVRTLEFADVPKKYKSNSLMMENRGKRSILVN